MTNYMLSVIAAVIEYFLWWNITNMMSLWYLVSSDYSLCISQIYISVYSFITLKKLFSLHLYFESSCHYRVSKSFYVDHHHIEKHIKTFFVIFIINDSMFMICLSHLLIIFHWILSAKNHIVFLTISIQFLNYHFCEES